MISYVRHYNPYSQLTAMALIDGAVHHLPVVTVESRMIDGEKTRHHPIVIAPDGQLLSVADLAQETPGMRYRICLQAELASAERRAQVEAELRGQTT